MKSWAESFPPALVCLLTFLPPPEHAAAKGSQACGQQKGQQHQDWGQDSDHWDMHPAEEMEGARGLSPDISGMPCTMAFLF